MIVSWSVGRGLYRLPPEARTLIVEALREMISALDGPRELVDEQFNDERFIVLAFNRGDLDAQAAMDELPRCERGGSMVYVTRARGGVAALQALAERVRQCAKEAIKDPSREPARVSALEDFFEAAQGYPDDAFRQPGEHG